MAAKNQHNVLAAVERIAAQARHEAVKEVEVTHAVLRRLRSRPRPTDRGLLILTAGSVAVAIVAALFSFPEFAGALDPLAMMMETTASSQI